MLLASTLPTDIKEYELKSEKSLLNTNKISITHRADIERKQLDIGSEGLEQTSENKKTGINHLKISSPTRVQQSNDEKS